MTYGTGKTASTRVGFTMRLFMPDGDPDGVKIIEKSNWSGAGLVIPRAIFAATRMRPELQRAGVYVLVGPSDVSQLPKVYVGEGDPVGPRLDQHVKTKDFWTHAVAFTSKDQNLNKAHVQFLEAQLLILAKAAKRCDLDNVNTPQGPSLSEADVTDVRGFLNDVLLCLAVLGHPYFEPAPSPGASVPEFQISAKGMTAKGYESPGGFVVRAGSQAASVEVKSIHEYLSQLRQSLRMQGVLVDAGGHLRLTQDYVFASPSTAAGVLLGRSANGRTEWKTADGRTLKAVQERDAGL
jgi:hypothetical protein